MKKEKVILIGMDGLMPKQVERYRADIPELDKFLKNGFFSPAYSSPYTCTATNWPTIATGAWVGTHGCTSFHAHLPGMELGETTPTFNSHLCQAEYFWHAAERQGKRSILINYPCAFPKLLKDGIVIGGDGLHSTQWTARNPDMMLSTPRQSSKMLPPQRILVKTPGKWINIPGDIKPLKEGVVSMKKGAGFTWDAAGIQEAEELIDAGQPDAEIRYLLVYERDGEKELLIARFRDASNPVAVMKPGCWTGWIKENFDGRDCLRQYKLLELSDNAETISIYGTRAATCGGWGYPAGIEEDIIKNAGGYIEALELEGSGMLRTSEWMEKVCLEIMEIQAHWTSDCASYLNNKEDWDAMFIQYHAPDGISHVYLRDLESKNKAVREKADFMLKETLRILFRMADRIVSSCADEETSVFIVSDHGNLPKKYIVMPDVMLNRKGWLTIKEFDERGRPVIDTRNSKACTGAHGVWINLKGREKHGCVQPGEEYENLRDAIIKKLLSMRNPENGECPFALVGRREDFAGMGMHGERVDDIVFFEKLHYIHSSAMGLFPTKAEFYKENRQFITLEEAVDYGLVWNLTAVHWDLPQATAGYASNRPIFMLSGPGIKKGTKGERRVNLVDVAPTMARILGINPPKESEGRVVLEAFEG